MSLEINPYYRERLEREGLSTLQHFLALPGEIYSGHPERHVIKVKLSRGRQTITAFLKREHRVPWRDRLTHAWWGEGFISKSRREAQLLKAAREAGLPCPEVLASGEDWRGRAFLLVRELSGCLDLRLFLHEHRRDPAPQRYRFAASLGRTLACLHNAHFAHRDLYAKHILVDPFTASISILDWQRAWRVLRPSWRRRFLDLAELNATLDEDLVSSRERLACLRAYLNAASAAERAHDGEELKSRSLRDGVFTIRRKSRRLLRKRHLREQRQVPLRPGTQSLIWLDGEALSVTPDFWARVHERPLWLPLAGRQAAASNAVLRDSILFPDGIQATLLRRWALQPGRWLWGWLRRKRPTSPEVGQACLLFRLQRYRIGTPRLLAVGQRYLFPGKLESFLLTEVPPQTVGLIEWFTDASRLSLDAIQRKARWQLIRATGRLLSRIHEAGCRGNDDLGRQLRVQLGRGEEARVVLGGVEGFSTYARGKNSPVPGDLQALRAALSSAGISRPDALRFLLEYLGLERLNPVAKRLYRRLALDQRSMVARR